MDNDQLLTENNPVSFSQVRRGHTP